MNLAHNNEPTESTIPRWIATLQKEIPHPPVASERLTGKGFLWACALFGVIELQFVTNRAYGMTPHYVLLALTVIGILASAWVIIHHSNGANEDACITYQRLLEQIATIQSLQETWDESRLADLKRVVAGILKQEESQHIIQSAAASRIRGFFFSLLGLNQSNSGRCSQSFECQFLEKLAIKVESVIVEKRRKTEEEANRQAQLNHEKKQNEQRALLGESVWNYRLAMIAKVERVAERDFGQWQDIRALLKAAGLKAVDIATFEASQSEPETRESVWKQHWKRQWEHVVQVATEASDHCWKHVGACDNSRRMTMSFLMKEDTLTSEEMSAWLSKLERIGEQEKRLQEEAETATQKLRELATIEMT